MAYATLAELRTYLGFETGNTDDDALLTALLARAQKLVDAYCGWSFEASSSTTRKYHAIKDVEGAVLRLDEPLLTCTEVVNGDGVTITSSYYVLEPTNTTPKWYIRLKGSSGYAWTYRTDPEEAISVTGTWGYMAAADAVVTQATLRWAAYLYRQKDAQVFDVTAQPGQGVIITQQGMPRDVRLMLDNGYRRLA